MSVGGAMDNRRMHYLKIIQYPPIEAPDAGLASVVPWARGAFFFVPFEIFQPGATSFCHVTSADQVAYTTANYDDLLNVYGSVLTVTDNNGPKKTINPDTAIVGDAITCHVTVLPKAGHVPEVAHNATPDHPFSPEFTPAGYIFSCTYARLESEGRFGADGEVKEAKGRKGDTDGLTIKQRDPDKILRYQVDVAAHFESLKIQGQARGAGGGFGGGRHSGTGVTTVTGPQAARGDPFRTLTRKRLQSLSEFYSKKGVSQLVGNSDDFYRLFSLDNALWAAQEAGAQIDFTKPENYMERVPSEAEPVYAFRFPHDGIYTYRYDPSCNNPEVMKTTLLPHRARPCKPLSNPGMIKRVRANFRRYMANTENPNVWTAKMSHHEIESEYPAEFQQSVRDARDQILQDEVTGVDDFGVRAWVLQSIAARTELEERFKNPGIDEKEPQTAKEQKLKRIREGVALEKMENNQIAALMCVLTEDNPQISDAERAISKWLHARNGKYKTFSLPPQAWYKNLSYFGNMMAIQSLVNEKVAQVFGVHAEASIVAMAVLSTPVGSGLRLNVVICGEHSLGKSFSFDLICDKLAIPGTTDVSTATSDKAHFAVGNTAMHMKSRFEHEANRIKWAINGEAASAVRGASSSSNQAVDAVASIFRDMLTAGKVVYERQVTDPETRKQTYQKIHIDAQTTNMAAVNALPSEVAANTKSRALVVDCVETQRDDISLARAIMSRGGGDDPFMADYQLRFQRNQAFIFVLSHMIRGRIIEDVNMELVNPLLVKLCESPATRGIRSIDEPRALERIRLIIKTCCLLEAIYKVFDSPQRTAPLGDFSWTHLKLCRYHTTASLEHFVYAMTFVSPEWDDPVERTLCQIIQTHIDKSAASPIGPMRPADIREELGIHDANVFAAASRLPRASEIKGNGEKKTAKKKSTKHVLPDSTAFKMLEEGHEGALKLGLPSEAVAGWDKWVYLETAGSSSSSSGSSSSGGHRPGSATSGTTSTMHESSLEQVANFFKNAGGLAHVNIKRIQEKVNLWAGLRVPDGPDPFAGAGESRTDIRSKVLRVVTSSSSPGSAWIRISKQFLRSRIANSIDSVLLDDISTPAVHQDVFITARIDPAHPYLLQVLTKRPAVKKYLKLPNIQATTPHSDFIHRQLAAGLTPEAKTKMPKSGSVSLIRSLGRGVADFIYHGNNEALASAIAIHRAKHNIIRPNEPVADVYGKSIAYLMQQPERFRSDRPQGFDWGDGVFVAMYGSHIRLHPEKVAETVDEEAATEEVAIQRTDSLTLLSAMLDGRMAANRSPDDEVKIQDGIPYRGPLRMNTADDHDDDAHLMAVPADPPPLPPPESKYDEPPGSSIGNPLPADPLDNIDDCLDEEALEALQANEAAEAAEPPLKRARGSA